MNAFSHVAAATGTFTRTREERQSSNLSGWLLNEADGTAWDFAVLNLSYGGCRIHTGAVLGRGQKVRLSVHGRGVIHAVVRWRRSDHVGLSFEVEQPRPKHWPRKADRFSFACPLIVRRIGRRAQSIDANDISVVGCCLNFTDAPAIGEVIWVKLPGLESLQAEVRWCKGFRCGVTFKNQIHQAVFNLMLSTTRESNNQPKVWQRLQT